MAKQLSVPSNEMLRQYRIAALTTPIAAYEMTNLDKAMSDILVKKDIPREQKLKLYFETLNQFLDARGLYFQGGYQEPLIDIMNTTPSSLSQLNQPQLQQPQPPPSSQPPPSFQPPPSSHIPPPPPPPPSHQQPQPPQQQPPLPPVPSPRNQTLSSATNPFITHPIATPSPSRRKTLSTSSHQQITSNNQTQKHRTSTPKTQSSATSLTVLSSARIGQNRQPLISPIQGMYIYSFELIATQIHSDIDVCINSSYTFISN